MRPLTIKPLIFLCATLLAPQVLARPVTVPISLNYHLIENVARSQLFSGPGNSADLYSDPSRCNVMKLTNPTIVGTADGQMVLEAGLSAQGGSSLGGNCLPLFAWSGTIRTQQKPYIKDDGMGVGFHVTDLHMEPADLAQPQMPPMLEGWVTAFVNPALETLTFDLKSVLGSTKTLLYEAIPGGQQDIDAIADSVAFADISGNSESLIVALQFELPDTMDLAAVPTDTLSQQELASWDAAWQSWDAFATWLIKNLASQTGVQHPELTQALADSLMEARYDLRLALIENNQSEDPVRQLFLKTWERLTPLLKSELSQSSELQGLQFLSLVSAVDALMAIDQVAESFSVQFDSATLRALARLINPAVTDAELNYSMEEDPELRKLLGLDPNFDGSNIGDDQWSAPLAFLFTPAQAAQLDPALVKKLNRWVPSSGEVDNYLTSMQQLLDAIAAKELEKGKIPPQYFAIYENLLLATAWQESCWRQFENRNGQVTPLKSSAGSVGVMQVNQHVWRGVYNTGSLVDDVVYNAKAGNEILAHYMADYAIKRKEHELGGGADALARSTYAMYNGGPGHISRYRKDTTGRYLKQIDAAFLKKYRDIQSRGTDAVKSCYGK